MNVRKKMAKGAFWLFLEKGIQQVLGFIVFAIIASMIGPKEYGLIALCTVILAFSKNITLGLVDSIVSMKIRDDERLSTLFWFVLVIGFVLSISSFLVAEYFSVLFGERKLKPLLQMISIIPVLISLTAVPIGLITAKMDFRLFALRSLIASILGGGVGVYLAYNGWGAYAIAIQQIVVHLSTVVIIFILSSWRPCFIFKSSDLKEMTYLGFGQTSSLIISFVEQQLPHLILGYFLGTTAVGYYAFVRRIIGVLQEGIIQPVLNVIYPAITQIVDKQEEKQKVIYQIVFILGAILFPIVVGLVLTSPLFITLIFDNKWASTTWLVQLFAPALILFTYNLLIRNILRAHKKIYVVVRIQILITFLSMLGVYLASQSGSLAWVLMALLLSSFLSNIAFSILVNKYVNISIWRCYLSLRTQVLSSLAMIGPILFVQNLKVLNDSIVVSLVFSVLSGILAYITVFTIFERNKLPELLIIFRKNIQG